MILASETQRIASCFLLLLLLASAAFASESEVRMSVLSLLKPGEIELVLESPDSVILRADPDGTAAVTPFSARKPIRIKASGGALQPSIGPSAPHLSIECQADCRVRIRIAGEMDRLYTGDFHFYHANSTINIVLVTHAEALAASIAASEMREAQEVEAIKAFSVVIRSFLMMRDRHPERSADFCDTTHCQVFQNLEASPEIQNAVRETESIVLQFRNQAFRPFYSRSCGGQTVTYLQAWGSSTKEYSFPSTECPCGQAANRWRVSISFAELSSMTGLKNPELTLLEDKILLVDGDRRMQFPLEGFRTKIGRALGWKRLPGNRYELVLTERGYDFLGIGDGHGVGFCQTGSIILARNKLSFADILSHYFPNTELRSEKNQRALNLSARQ